MADAGCDCAPFGATEETVGIHAVVIGDTAIMSCQYRDLEDEPLARLLCCGVHRANLLVYVRDERLEPLIKNAVSVDGEGFVGVTSYVVVAAGAPMPVLTVAKRRAGAAVTPQSPSAGGWADAANCIWSLANGEGSPTTAKALEVFPAKGLDEFVAKELEIFIVKELEDFAAYSAGDRAAAVRCYEVAEAVAVMTPRDDLLRALEVSSIIFIKQFLANVGFVHVQHNGGELYVRKRMAVWAPFVEKGEITYEVELPPADKILEVAFPATIVAAFREALMHVRGFEHARLFTDHIDQSATAAQKAGREIAEIRASAAKAVAERPADAENTIAAMAAAVRERYPPGFRCVCFERFRVVRETRMKHRFTVEFDKLVPSPDYQRAEPPAELTTVGAAPLR
jgi:hypothetical protein